jgi:F-type H+-transporting ATPase subunit b
VEINLWLVLIQLLPFAAAVFVLNRLVYRPFLAYLAERENNMEGFEREARVLLDEVESREASLESELAEVRVQAGTVRAEILAAASTEEEAISTEAHARANQQVDEAMERIASEEQAALKSLEEDAQDLAGRVASQVIGRTVGILAMTAPLLWTGVAWAAGDGGDHGEGHSSGPQWYWLGMHFLNLVIFLYLLVRFGRRPINDFLANRKAEISAGLVKAQEMRAEADRRRDAVDERLAGLDDEKANIREAAREVAESEKEGRIERARRHAQAQMKGAERVIADEEGKAANRVRVAVAERALQLAQSRIDAEFNDSDQDRLWQEFLTQVEQEART